MTTPSVILILKKASLRVKVCETLAMTTVMTHGRSLTADNLHSEWQWFKFRKKRNATGFTLEQPGKFSTALIYIPVNKLKESTQMMRKKIRNEKRQKV